MSASPSLSGSVSAGLHAARANLVPGLFLQGIALSVVLSYYFYPPATELLGRLSAFRAETGFLFSMCSTALAGGLLPFLILRFFGSPEARMPWSMGVLVTCFWGYKGFEVDLWYRALAWIFGEGNGFWTVAAKTLCDQAIYCPIIAIPFTVFVYAWGLSGFNMRATLQDLRQPNWYARRVLTPLLSNLGIWLPACAIIYSLPTALQVPLQNMVLAFFTLILAHLTAKEHRRHEA